MKKSRFTESQIVAILKKGEAGVAVAQITRKHGISAATYYHWKRKYAGAWVWHDFDNFEAAKAFANFNELKAAMKGAGVVGAPAIWFARHT